MSGILPTSIGYISPHGDFSRHNTQALSGVSHLWQDFFARAMAEQQEEPVDSVSQSFVQYDHDSGEPIGGARALALIDAQRACPVLDTEVTPPEPLFLPKAELEASLLPPAPEPFSAMELIEQQRQLDTSNSWMRPVVMSQGHPIAEPGPGPAPRSLFLPIAEFETNLLDPAPEPFDDATLAKQQNDLEFDIHWARPVVLNNVRVHA